MVVSFGFCKLMNAVFSNWTSVTGGSYGLSGIPKATIFGHSVTGGVQQMILVWVILLVCFYTTNRLMRSPYGELVEAMRQDETALEALGKSPFRIKVVNSSISGVFCAIAAALYIQYIGYADPVNFNQDASFTLTIYVFLGGAATMCGDPPNIIIGTALGLTFGDFLQNTGLIVLVSMVVIVPFFYFAFRKQVATQDEAARQKAMEMDPKASIHSWRKFALNVGVFLLTVVLLITHAKTGLTVAMVGVIAAVLTLLVNKDPILLLKRVDWQTVLFFIGLFLAVSGLEQTGVLEAMAQGIAHITGGSLTLMVIIILWLSGIASAFVDNIPFAATMVPVITSLSATMGVDLNALAWTLSMGTDIGGSGTPIGASANVAGTAIAAREGYAIGWGRYCKYSAPAAVIVLAISMVMLLLRY